MNINSTVETLSNNCAKLNTLLIDHCRIDDKVTPFLLQLMTLKLQNLSIINCKRLKNESYKDIARKQQQYLTSSSMDVV